VVFDSVTEMRLLAEEPRRLRHQILALKQFLRHGGRRCCCLSTKPAHPPPVGNQMFAVTSAAATESRQWLKSSG
jgi:hypothetical protein